MAPTCEKNVQIKLTAKNFLLIIFNVVYIEVKIPMGNIGYQQLPLYIGLPVATHWLPLVPALL
jgi:hypothetical protein